MMRRGHRRRYDVCVYVTPGSSVARTPGWSVIAGAGRELVRACRAGDVGLEVGIGVRDAPASGSDTGGWSGADGSLGCATTYAVAPTKDAPATSTAIARSASAFI